MSKNLIFGLVAAACVISAVILTQEVEKKDEFSVWKSKFPVSWGSEEDSYRRMVFLANL